MSEKERGWLFGGDGRGGGRGGFDRLLFVVNDSCYTILM